LDYERRQFFVKNVDELQLGASHGKGLTCSFGATKFAKSAKLVIFLKLPRPSLEATFPLGVFGGLGKGSVAGDEVVVCVVGLGFRRDVARYFSSGMGEARGARREIRRRVHVEA
jgi:hypothetical protein